MQLQVNSKPSSAYQKAAQFLINGLSGEQKSSQIGAPIEGSPQEQAYHCTADVIGYGGASRGGKSYLALLLAFNQHKRSRLFRTTYTALRGLIDEGDGILAGKARFIEGKGWRFNGRTVMVGYVEHEKEWEKWKGDSVDLMVFDEADQFPQSVIENLSAWNGTTDPNQIVRRLICFNPPGIKGEWLLSYFGAWIDDRHSNPAKDGEIRYYIRNEDDSYSEIPDNEVTEVSGDILNQQLEAKGEVGFYIEERQYHCTSIGGEWRLVESRTFFKALIDDNPYAMRTGYARKLESLREPLRSQLRWGDFSAGTPDDADQLIPTEWIIRAQERHQLMQPPALRIRATGVDPSRGGKDEFVIANLRGTYFDDLICHEGHTIPKIKGGQHGAKLVMAAIGKDKPRIGVDADGIGASVYDQLLEYNSYEVYAINSGSAGYGTDKSGMFPFTNLRSMMWWRFYEALDPESGLYIALPPDRTLRNELRAPKYSTKTGKIQVEKKEDIKKRINRSTNRADAVIYTWYIATFIQKPAKPRAL